MCVGLGRGVVCVCVGHHRSVGLSLLLSGERDLALGGEERGAVVAVAVVVSVVSVSVSVVAVAVAVAVRVFGGMLVGASWSRGGVAAVAVRASGVTRL